MRRRLNIKLLIGLVVTSGLLGGVVHLVHGFQEKRNIGALLKRADLAERNGDHDEAEKYLSRYLAFRPDDGTTLARYGLALAKGAPGGAARAKALMVLERALLRVPDRDDVRRRAAELGVELGRPKEASEPIVTLLLKPGLGQVPSLGDRRRLEAQLLEFSRRKPEEGPPAALKQLLTRPDPALEELLGRCFEDQGRTSRRDEAEAYYRKAAACYRLALAQAPDQIETYGRLSALLRERMGDPAQADRVMDASELKDGLIAKNPQSFRAYLLRARYRKENGLAGAAEDVAQAQQLAPHEFEVLVANAESARLAGKLDTARTLLQEGESSNPKDVRIYQSRMAVETQAGRVNEATAALRRGLKALPDQVDLLWNLAESLIQAGQLDEAAVELKKLRQKNDILTAPIDYLDGRLLVAKGRWPEAIRILEKSRALMAGTPSLNSLTKQADLLLAQGYEWLGLPEQRLAACRRALALDPQWVPARLAQAAALLALGRSEAAIESYRSLVPQAPSVRPILARLLVAQNLRLTAEQQRDPVRWQEVETLLDQAEQAAPTSVEVPLLRAEILTARGRIEEARGRLEVFKKAHPDRVEPWIALSQLAEEEGKPDDALALIKQAENQLGDRVELRLAEASYWGRRGGDEAPKKLGELTQALEKLASKDRPRLEDGLANAYLRLGNLQEADRIWTEAAKRRPEDRQLATLLLGLSLRRGDDESIGRSSSRLRQIEGEDGALWRYADAARLVLRAKPGNGALLSQARTLLAEVSKKRPEWALVSLLEGEIAEKEGKPDRAIESYLKAIRGGERPPQVVRQVIQLLNQHGRTVEADRLIEDLLKSTPPVGLLGQLAAEKSLRNRDQGQALELARQAIAPDSKDYHDRIWLAQMLWAAKKPAEAEVELRRAVAMAGKEPEVWMALIQFLSETDQKVAAEQAIAEAGRQLPPDLVTLTLARCYDRIGDRAKAEEQYVAALKTHPDNAAIHLTVANFYLATQRPENAQTLLRKVLDPQLKAPQQIVASARRSLALSLANGDSESFLEAASLLDKNIAEEGGLIEDQRFKALLLASRPGHRREAIAKYEELAQRSTPSPLEKYQLAQLHAAGRDWSKARDLLLSLVSVDAENPDYLYSLSRVLLARGDLDQARPWITKLEKATPESLQVVELKARLLHKDGKGTEAVAALEARAASDPNDGLAIASLLEELNETAAAERLTRKFVDQSKDPKAVLVLALFLGRHGRDREALDLCEGAWKTCPPVMVSNAALRILHAAKADDEQSRRVMTWIEEEIRKSPNEVQLMFDLANLKILQRHYPDAEALMRRIIALKPGTGGPMNNLAWLLAARGEKAEEALDLINRAITLDGSNPEALDTRGLVYLALGKPEAALKDLTEAATVNPSPLLFFHLARAQMRSDRRDAARETLRKAQAAGLVENAIDPLEREDYRRLVAALSP
ncbi:Tetratricopeptide repeat-containing protein [Singulisphaera sp. GP187]|uniref:tetratricopeptide repeat protein n=1 Tax=Singulisphaera sp. GP187 TaxID=1882752 RepID=UPI000927909F|nr:tetratricopeptide repeat protein [Singulisphaera sp. GP187]SIO55099.1 Tetratricopeptide repeat-containing protein [Singulisphaera sp. GP187]